MEKPQEEGRGKKEGTREEGKEELGGWGGEARREEDGARGRKREKVARWGELVKAT